MRNRNTFQRIANILVNRETKGNINLILELLASKENTINYLDLVEEEIFQERMLLSLASYAAIKPLVKPVFLNLLFERKPRLLFEDNEISLPQNHPKVKENPNLLNQKYIIYSPLLIAIRYRNLSSVNFVLAHPLIQQEQEKNLKRYAVKLSRAYIWAQRWYYKCEFTFHQQQILGVIYSAYNAVANTTNCEQRIEIRDVVKQDYFDNLLNNKYYFSTNDKELIFFLMSAIQILGISYEDHIASIRHSKNSELEFIVNDVEMITNENLYAMIKMTDEAKKDIDKSLNNMSDNYKDKETSNQRS